MSNLDVECQVSEIYLKYMLGLPLTCTGRLASQELMLKWQQVSLH